MLFTLEMPCVQEVKPLSLHIKSTLAITQV